MRFDLDKAFGIHQYGMVLRAKRAELLANNIANVDTPNFKARDMDFKSALQQAQNGITSAAALRTTHSKHISSGIRVAGMHLDTLYRNPMQPSVDGNTVDSQIEKAEFTSNAVQYQVSVKFLSGLIKSLKTAIKGE
ncbi:MAG: flagellar basal body rod protein FlgB [Gammaproteobacteria bacterium]|nr:flagellar basal body rod protein FlgB [Gammaproteobacteria bacterium]